MHYVRVMKTNETDAKFEEAIENYSESHRDENDAKLENELVDDVLKTIDEDIDLASYYEPKPRA